MTFDVARIYRPFNNRRLGLVRLLAVIVALCHAGVSYANFVSTSHEPAVWPEHEGISMIPDLRDHDHDHDPADGDTTLHPHGHNASDHSHDKSNLPSSSLHAGLSPGNVWNAPVRAPVYPSPCFDFERPPKRLPTP